MTDTYTGEQRRTVTDYAIAQIGKPYVWGTKGPDAFDCSGLVVAAWAHVGLTLPHNSLLQSEMSGTSVGGTRFTYLPGGHNNRALLAPGDLVFSYSPVSHVGMYVGFYEFGGVRVRHVVQGTNEALGIQLIPMFAYTPPTAYMKIGH